MAATKTRASSFSRNVSVGASAQSPGIKCGPNGTFFVSSGIPDLDRILGGGFPLGSLAMVMEDAEAPHHLLLLRNFMSQGLVHHQPLLYASPLADPRGFLGTLPSPALSTDEKSRRPDLEQDKGLRIAWQYRKYFGENQHDHKDSNQHFCSEFDLRKPLEKHFFTEKRVDCFSFKEYPLLSTLRDRCSSFFMQFTRNDVNVISPCRVAIQSLCAPHCEHSDMEWDTLSFLRSLKTMLQSANGVAIVSFPPSLLSASYCKRLQHMSDILLSVRAIPDDDKELAKLLTGYQDMVGFLNVHKVSRMNSQVPVILETTTFSMKLQKRRYLVLECLNQAPVDGSSGSSYDTKSGSCFASSKSSSLEF